MIRRPSAGPAIGVPSFPNVGWIAPSRARRAVSIPALIWFAQSRTSFGWMYTLPRFGFFCVAISE